MTFDPLRPYRLRRPAEYGGGQAEAMGGDVPALLQRGYRLVVEEEAEGVEDIPQVEAGPVRRNRRKMR